MNGSLKYTNTPKKPQHLTGYEECHNSSSTLAIDAHCIQHYRSLYDNLHLF